MIVAKYAGAITESSTVWDTSYLVELIDGHINRQFLREFSQTGEHSSFVNRAYYSLVK